MADARPGRVPTAAVVEKQRQALELKRAGVTYDVIATTLGYANRGGAYKAVKRGLTQTLQEPADELRSLQVDRLERLHHACWMKALGGDLAAVDRVLRIAAELRTLLGLAVPPATGGRAGGELDAEIERLVFELEGGAARSPTHPG